MSTDKEHVLPYHSHGGISFFLEEIVHVLHEPYHHHAAVELIYCQRVNGTKIIGNHISPLVSEELILIGKQLPHAIQLNEPYYRSARGVQPHLQRLTIKEELLNSQLFALREFHHIDELMKRAQRGIRFSEPTTAVAAKFLERIEQQSGVDALLAVIALLDHLGKATEFTFLNSIGAAGNCDAIEIEKIKKVFAFTERHYREPITLAQAAELINFTQTSFCRYFKKQTGTSFFQYLTDLRISHACRILMEEPAKGVEEICFLSGFNNPSNFYKQFKRKMGITPKEYQARGKSSFLSY